MTPILRPMSPDDAVDASRLMLQLGYEASPIQLERRLAALREWPEQDAFVALVSQGIVGLCHVQGVRLLATDGYAEIQALVVSEAARGQGVGKALVRHAGTWALERGHRRLRLRSGVQRLEAHAFYEALGFEKSRSSFAFEIELGHPGSGE